MPAYFNISLVFERKDIKPDFTKDVHEFLHKAGFIFKSGCFEADEYSLEEILLWNQKHLENNFSLGFTEHYSHDYKQMYFTFGDFSEVRAFWMNNYPEDDEFTLEIIIPEYEILEYDGNEKYGYFYKVKEIQMIINACRILWNNPLLKMIQTGLESSDEVVSLKDIQTGALPNIYPFAIIPNELTQNLGKEFCVEKLDFRGILIHEM